MSYSNLGGPVAVDVASIEQELTSLWKSASEHERDAAVIRACSCNLVVIAHDRSEAQSVIPVLARVSEWHPNRTLIAYPESGAADDGHIAGSHMRAWISAQCSLPMLGGPQICSESITIAADESAAAEVPSTVLSLIVPDLQVFLYWRCFKESEWDWAGSMARFSSLLIVDSHQSKDDPKNRERLLELLMNPPGGIKVRDLNWSRITSWRDLVSQFFDSPAYRNDVYQISEIEINRALSRPGNIPTRTLLLTGWLASSLKWRRIASECVADQWLSRWESASGNVTVRFTGAVAAPTEPAGISSITIRTRTGATFSVVRERGSSFMTATASGRGPGLVHSVPQDSTDEGDLLIRELSLVGEDVLYLSTLTEALALEKSFRS